MKISEAGLTELIKPFEGYHTRQIDGSCKAYLCPAGKWTCGWGCTSGVGPHTHWTQAEATAALAAEMEEHERNVERLVKVPLLQPEFDALVSLCYNIGAGNLAKSTLLKHLNAGDKARAASHFSDFKRARVQGATALQMKVAPGTSVVLPGLVERRAAETSHFLSAEPERLMAQAVEPADAKWKLTQALAQVGTPAAGAGAATATAAAPFIPGIPDYIAATVNNAAAWTKLATSIDLRVLLIGGATAGVTALAMKLIGRSA